MPCLYSLCRALLLCFRLPKYKPVRTGIGRRSDVKHMDGHLVVLVDPETDSSAVKRLSNVRDCNVSR